MPNDKQTILVVDDTPENIDILVGTLKDKYQVKAAINGEMALKIARAEPPDIVLLDIMMPGIDGYEVCRQLKDDPQTTDIPIIFITAKIGVEDQIKGLELGAVDYITKPISPPIVMARVQTHLALYDQQRELDRQVREQTRNLVIAQEKLEMLVKEGLALSNEKQLDKLVTLIFQTAQKLVHADGGVMYLMEGDELGVELLSLGSESLMLGGLSEYPAPRVKINPAITSFLSQESVLRSASESFNSRTMVKSGEGEFTLFPTGLPGEPFDYPIRSLVAVPIITQRDEILGVIQLFNPGQSAVGSSGDVIDDNPEKFIESLASQAAVTLDNRNLVTSLRELFDALVQVVAFSIDAKSPYTGGHCTRVPALAQMLAQAVHETETGPLAEFQLKSDDDWRQLWLAAWLHDCGKVSTPEFVVDKATKLETVYDRIHEIRMRFEVLRRDALIEHYQELIGDEHGAELPEKLQHELLKLREEFEFIARCNLGGEFLNDEELERLKNLGERTWLRHYSDRIGISEEELWRKSATLEPDLPVAESLLADKLEHLTARTQKYEDIVDAEGNPMQVPEHEYNRGEIYNLSIGRGTITAEERFKIIEHTLTGLNMLKQIPFPESLTRVPEIATEHHENLIGTGYPFRKKKEHLSVESRILAVADVFEALTARDRPYKKANSLAEALRIMGRMRDEQHLDGDILDIFLQSGVFRQYAEGYLDAEQLDVDDISSYLSSAD
jgi:response regulator RpfG family c-di-GMP phosphodiesterase